MGTVSRGYSAYLRSPQWNRRRKKAIDRAGYQCETCGSKLHLHVHHLTYVSFKHELPQDLRALCSDCHTKVHPHMRRGAPMEPKNEPVLREVKAQGESKKTGILGPLWYPGNNGNCG